MRTRLIDLENDFTEEEEAVFQVNPHPQVTNPMPDVTPEQVKDFQRMMKEEAAATPNRTVLPMEDVVVKQYKLGMSLRAIQKEHGISNGKVYEILARKKVPLRNGRYKSRSQKRISQMSELEKQSLISDYKNGMELTEIFRKYNINKNGTYQLLDEANVPRRNDRVVGNAPAPEMVHNIKKASGESEQLTMEMDYTKPKAYIVPNKQTAPVELRVEGTTLHVDINRNVQSSVDKIVLNLK